MSSSDDGAPDVAPDAKVPSICPAVVVSSLVSIVLLSTLVPVLILYSLRYKFLQKQFLCYEILVDIDQTCLAHSLLYFCDKKFSHEIRENINATQILDHMVVEVAIYAL